MTVKKRRGSVIIVVLVLITLASLLLASEPLVTTVTNSATVDSRTTAIRTTSMDTTVSQSRNTCRHLMLVSKTNQMQLMHSLILFLTSPTRLERLILNTNMTNTCRESLKSLA